MLIDVNRIPIIDHVPTLRRARMLIILLAITLVSCGQAGPPDGGQRVAGNGSGRIAFVKTNPAEEIYVMEADGSQQTRLTTDAADDGHPSWSPDGSHIAFQSTRDGLYQIFVMEADGSHQRPLTTSHIFNESMNYMPAWSPNRRSSP